MRLRLEGFLFVAAIIDAPALTRARRQSKRSSKATAEMIETATETAMMRVVLLDELPAVTSSPLWPMMERDNEGGGGSGGGGDGDGSDGCGDALDVASGSDDGVGGCGGS